MDMASNAFSGDQRIFVHGVAARALVCYLFAVPDLVHDGSNAVETSILYIYLSAGEQAVTGWAAARA